MPEISGTKWGNARLKTDGGVGTYSLVGDDVAGFLEIANPVLTILKSSPISMSAPCSVRRSMHGLTLQTSNLLKFANRARQADMAMPQTSASPSPDWMAPVISLAGRDCLSPFPCQPKAIS